MNEKNRMTLKAVVFGLVVLSFLLFSLMLFSNGNESSGVMALLVAVIVALFGAKFLKGRYELVKKGIVQEDERTDRVMKNAGYYTFLAMIWVLLGLMWYAGTGVEEMGFPGILPRHVAAVGMLASAVLFGVFYLYFDKFGLQE